MEETQEQAVPNNGASNAADFQPPTKSPQTAPVADVQQQSGLQGVTNTQEFFNDNKSAQISVTSQPAPAQAQAKNDPTGLSIIAVVAVIVAIVLYKLSNRLPAKTKAKKAKTETVTPEVTKTSEAKETTVKPKKSAAKRKSTKKSKRRNK